MGKKSNEERNPANHLRAWREFKGFTQEELGFRIGTTGSVIALLEKGERGLTHKWLAKIAPVLETTPGFLLDYHPGSLPAEWLTTIREIPEDAQPQALDILKTFKKRA